VLGARMMLFTFQSVKKLNRKATEIYLGTIPLGIIKSWNLALIDASSTNSDVVVVSYDTLVNASNNEIQVTNPAFICQLPSGNENDEYPVLFVTHNNYLREYIMSRLLSVDFFNRLIEKSEKISSNSTKLITLRSLQDILKNLVVIRLDRTHWPLLYQDMIMYLQSLVKVYPQLGYLPVSERRSFRKVSTADASFAWEFYFKFFIEEWAVKRSAVGLPDMSKSFEYNNWIGDFFDRANPLWKLYVGTNGKFMFNDAIRESIYEIWKEWVKRA
jgi:hypothetical protein